MLEAKPLKILIAGCNESDFDTAKLCFEQTEVPVKLTYLSKESEIVVLLGDVNFEENHPQLILLCLQNSLMVGFEVLKKLKNDNNYRKIPILVFGSSTSENEIDESYNLGASCYIYKPQKQEDWCEMMKRVAAFWLDCVRLAQ